MSSDADLVSSPSIEWMVSKTSAEGNVESKCFQGLAKDLHD